MLEAFLNWIADTEGFPTRNNCCVHGEVNPWTPTFIASMMLANGAIALAYFVNPLVLMYLWRKWSLSGKFGAVGSLAPVYALFTFSCGMGHLLSSVLVFYWPAYHFFVLWDWGTALVSWAANVSLLFLAVQFQMEEDKNGRSLKPIS